MQYTTTRCPHCGFYTRNRESGVPKVELGQTLACCPRCNNPIVDPIKTEYEFMTQREQQKWSTDHLVGVETFRGVFMLIIGIIALIGGIASGDGSGVAIALIFGVGLIAMGIGRFISANKAKELNIGEQAIYESILRTSNSTYVSLLQSAYQGKRIYSPLENRTATLNEYKGFSTDEVHQNYKTEFEKLLRLIDDDIYVKETKSSTSFVNGGAISGGIMAIPSAITEIKQGQEIANKNKVDTNNINENIEMCSECGYQIFPEEIECGNCGKKRNIVKKSVVDDKKKRASSSKNIKKANTQSDKNSNKDKLLELKNLFKEELITEDEYNEKRKKIIDAL